MKSLHIRDIDESTLEGLKRRAARHRRSLQKEVQLLLEQAALMTSEKSEASETPKLSLHTVHSGLKGSMNWERDSIYDDDGR